MSIELVMPSNHLILCHPLLLLPSVFPSIRVFSSELALSIRWPKYWSFSFSISPSMASVENYNSATMVSHRQAPTGQGKKKSFIEGKGIREVCSKQRVHGFSLTESLPAEKSFFLGLAGPCCCCRSWKLPLLVAQLYLTEVSLNSFLQIKPQESLVLKMILSPKKIILRVVLILQ